MRLESPGFVTGQSGTTCNHPRFVCCQAFIGYPHSFQALDFNLAFSLSLLTAICIGRACLLFVMLRCMAVSDQCSLGFPSIPSPSPQRANMRMCPRFSRNANTAIVRMILGLFPVGTLSLFCLRRLHVQNFRKARSWTARKVAHTALRYVVCIRGVCIQCTFDTASIWLFCQDCLIYG